MIYAVKRKKEEEKQDERGEHMSNIVFLFPYVKCVTKAQC